MNFSEIKNRFYESKIQTIQINKEGIILQTESTIFPFSKNDDLSSKHPFFEGIKPLFADQTSDLHFPCVNLEIETKQVIVDVNLITNESGIFIVIIDFTEHYRDSHPIVQEKNEASIAKAKLAFEKNILIAKEEIKNKFLAHLNHEIRNPLNSLLGFMELLKKSRLDYEQQEMLKVMNKTGMHLKVLLDDLLDISRIVKGETEVKNIPLSLTLILTNLVKHFDLKYIDKSIDLQLNIEDGVPPKIISDPTRINQILFNLIENAYRNTEEGTIVIAVALKKENTLIITVSDTGKGIPETELPQIFDSYYQLHFDETLPMGEGLGLRIVKELTQLLNGEITVTSQESKGTSYYLTLPFNTYDKPESRKRSVPKGTGIVISKRILIAENDKDHQMLLMKNFIDNDRGYIIDFSIDGNQTLENLEKRKYSLLILKMKLPDLDGFTMLSYIRNHTAENIRELPVLIVTGSTMTFEREKIMSEGASGFLAKPYTKKQLYKEIEILLKN